jgi:hypothetical protein
MLKPYKIGLLWLKDDYSVNDEESKEIKEFDKSALYKGNYLLIDRSHDDFDEYNEYRHRARVEIYDGKVKISYGLGCPRKKYNEIKKYMGLNKLWNSKIVEFQNDEWDGEAHGIIFYDASYKYARFFAKYDKKEYQPLLPEEIEALLVPIKEFKEEEIDITRQASKQIIEHHRNLGYKKNKKGYTRTNEENLLEMYSNWDEIKKELTEGDGNELKRKFRAVHSSSALCVNNFALVKQHKNNVSLFGETGFSEAVFEKKFPTFLRTPVNLDFYLENNNSRIGIESKFTETLRPALLKDKNLKSYINHKKLPKELQRKFNDFIECYLSCKKKKYLDAAQLIEHLIALSLYAVENPGKTTKLVYLYWLPFNYGDFKAYEEHFRELFIFAVHPEAFKLPLTFEAYSYPELWDMMEKNEVLSDILKKIRARYGTIHV